MNQHIPPLFYVHFLMGPSGLKTAKKSTFFSLPPSQIPHCTERTNTLEPERQALCAHFEKMCSGGQVHCNNETHKWTKRIFFYPFLENSCFVAPEKRIIALSNEFGSKSNLVLVFKCFGENNAVKNQPIAVTDTGNDSSPSKSRSLIFLVKYLHLVFSFKQAARHYCQFKKMCRRKQAHCSHSSCDTVFISCYFSA